MCLLEFRAYFANYDYFVFSIVCWHMWEKLRNCLGRFTKSSVQTVYKLTRNNNGTENLTCSPKSESFKTHLLSTKQFAALRLEWNPIADSWRYIMPRIKSTTNEATNMLSKVTSSLARIFLKIEMKSPLNKIYYKKKPHLINQLNKIKV